MKKEETRIVLIGNRRDAILFYMQKQGVSMTELAKRMDVTCNTVSRTLKKQEISNSTFKRYAKVLGIEEFLTLQDIEKITK